MKEIINIRLLFFSLILVLVILFFLSISFGSINISFIDIFGSMLNLNGNSEYLLSIDIIVKKIRLPRIVLGCTVGALLALSGVTMQCLFRNPLADPGLIGVSSGASLGAAIAIIFSIKLQKIFPECLIHYILEFFSFLGGLIITVIVYLFGRQNNKTNVFIMLLIGISFSSISSAIIGLLTYIADDNALRTLMFWNLGSLNGATYIEIFPILLILIFIAFFLQLRAHALNALLLGESEARNLGFDVEKLKLELISCSALGVGVSVASVGMIGFIGLVIPHIIRLITGPDHRIVLPFSMIAGSILLILADLISRLILAPVEIPIGIIINLIGSTFFIYLLIKKNH